ncbi:MAG: GNAT family N-acetyltransferase [Enhygromyxa sp.]
MTRAAIDPVIRAARPGEAAELLALEAAAGRRYLAARGAIPRAASLGLSAAGFVAETCSTPSTAAFRLRASDENPGARRHEGLHHGLLAAGLPGDLEGLPPELVDAAIAEGTTWVCVDAADRPIGFALCWIREDALHLRELDVAPEHMGRGLGRALVEFVCAKAAELELGRVTLTTFAEVEWNAPLYRRWGFEVLEPAATPAWLAAIRAQEDAGELREWPRVAMGRRVR